MRSFADCAKQHCMAADYEDNSPSQSGSDEERRGTEVARLYCDAITKLTPDIVAVLRNESGGILSKAYSEGLIGEDLYRTGLLLQDCSKQVEHLLLMVKSQIMVKLSSYNKFLEILRSTLSTEDTALIIEKKVEELRSKHRRVKKVKKKGKKSSVRSRENNDFKMGMPTLDAYSSGFHDSDLSIDLTGDPLSPLGSEPEGINYEVPIQEVGPALYSEFVGEAGDSYGIVSNLQEQLKAMVVENQKLEEEIKRQDSLVKRYEEHVKELKEHQHVAIESQQKIQQLEQKFVEMQAEMKRREEELLADIVQKSEDIEMLTRTHKNEIKELEDQCKESVSRVSSELEMERQKRERSEQYFLKLDRDLQEAKNEKITLEKQKGEADLKLAELRIKYVEEIAAIKEKMYNLKEDALEKVHTAKMEVQREKTEREKAKMQAQQDAQEMIHEARMEAQREKTEREKAEMQAQMKIHKVESETQLQLALTEQAQGFVRTVCEAQRSISSSSGGSAASYEERLSMSILLMQQISITQASSNSSQTEQPTPSEDTEKQPFSEP